MDGVGVRTKGGRVLREGRVGACRASAG